MEIIRGKIKTAKKVVIYGPEGIGKSTFASRFPDPVFLDTEGSTRHMDVARAPKASSWTMLMEQVRYFKEHPKECKTLVLDTADWAERLCREHVLTAYRKKSIEEFGYGKGYVYLAEEFGRLLNRLEEVVEAGVNVVVTAHAQMRKFEQPDELGSYDRWELKLSKQSAPLLKEWADLLLFANYKTFVVNVDGQGSQKGKNKAQGGRRVLYSTHHPCWDAKNRYDLPEEMELSFGEIAHLFSGNVVPEKAEPEGEVRSEAEPPQLPAFMKQEEAPSPEMTEEKEAKAGTAKTGEAGPPAAPEKEGSKADPDKPPEHYLRRSKQIPKALADLMEENGVDEWEIQEAVGIKGYYPNDVLIEEYDPGFVEGVLVGAWGQVFGMIKEMREKQEIPFN